MSFSRFIVEKSSSRAEKTLAGSAKKLAEKSSSRAFWAEPLWGGTCTNDCDWPPFAAFNDCLKFLAGGGGWRHNKGERDFLRTVTRVTVAAGTSAANPRYPFLVGRFFRLNNQICKNVKAKKSSSRAMHRER